ncbi:hypothetical protein PIB30_105138 [Stylosanthes scabra]|uniref:Uncharacterized protein n=1 Tax=Stylosanthes scabra TaxID=79078 RepID=A0ABU6W1L4_9FABA|nr:hypothetical protein [Stylosanthes scabra]
MGSGVIFYEYEKREKFEDHDTRADAELGTFKVRRYHFDNESFVHSLHSVRFDPDRPYEIPIEALLADKIASASRSEESSAERRRWMCDANDEKEIVGMDPSDKGESSEEDPEMEEEYPEEADAEEDFQRYVKELGRVPEPSPLRSSQASAPKVPVEAAD